MPGWQLLTGTLGGLGLFLLGMWLLTEALKLGGGTALRQILSNWSLTRLRAFGSGFAVTALVQSSSAVTVAVIGFVNAGLLDLSRSVWIIFGSNVGTTMTAWIVAFIGLKIKIDVFALPAIGIGSMLHLFSKHSRWQALGGALAGLGLLFLGLQLLQQTFGGLGGQIDLLWANDKGPLSALLMVLLGLVLTALMQSSSASMAIVLTAVAADVIPLYSGALAVIGANIGTTVTALLAVLKATSNARRVAVAHVVFNVVTAIAGVALLGVLLTLVGVIESGLVVESNPAVTLALFHTVFNLMGVLLMIPIEKPMVARLKRLFRSREEELSTPQFLDPNTVQVPELALRALFMEELRVLTLLGPALSDYLKSNKPLSPNALLDAMDQLLSSINDFIAECSRQPLPDNVSGSLQAMLMVNTHLDIAIDNVRELEPLLVARSGFPARINTTLNRLISHIDTLTQYSQQLQEARPRDMQEFQESFEADYRDARQQLLEAGRLRSLNMRHVEDIAQHLSVLKRVIKQYRKAIDDILEIANQPPFVAEAAESETDETAA